MRRLYRPLIFRTASAFPVVSSLDAYTDTLFSLCSMRRRFLNRYTGPLIRVRRAGDNAERDIGFAGALNALDVAALQFFAGTDSAFLVKKYDQTGVGNDQGQATAMSQPRIVNAGVFDGAAIFDGLDDCLTTPALPGGNSGMSFFLHGNIRGFVGTTVWFESGDGTGTDLGCFYDSTNVRIDMYSGGPSATNFIFQNSATQQPANDVTAYVGDRTQSTPETICKYYKAGVLLTPTGASGGANSGNYRSATVNIGSRSNGASFAALLDTKSALIYTSALNATDVAAISNILAS